MNKLAIPAILTAAVLVAGIFAFMPVEQASTVHTTIVTDILGEDSTTNDDIVANLDRLDVTVFASGPAPNPAAVNVKLIAGPGVVDSDRGEQQIEIDILVVDPDGSGVVGLDLVDFTFTFTARDGGDGITEIGGDFADVGDGLYTISADADTDFGDDGDSLAYIITVVVDDVDDGITDAVGTGTASMTVIVTANE